MDSGVIIIGGLINGLICGFISMAIASSRNMRGGFWWGALLGIIGIIVVAVRPNDNYSNQSVKSSYPTEYGVEPPIKPGTYAASFDEKEKKHRADILEKNGWRCPKCGRTHYEYVSLCPCGTRKETVMPSNDSTQEQKLPKEKISEAEEIRKYKELADDGIITQEEFEAKKKQLLDL